MNTHRIQLLPLRGTPVQQVNTLLQKAIEMQASDIHIEPFEGQVRVRFRLDGVLHLISEVHLAHKEAIVSRIKIMANLDIAEKRRPQDGRASFAHQHRHIDLRISTLPTPFGEKVVLRLLDRENLNLSLEALGLQDQNLALYQHALDAPNGMILVTGPTGSGKTTTLYASLATRNSAEVNILTVEDPIEYHLKGINQVQVHPEIGLTFAAALRAFLRQDPDVIMVGEIRDKETAEMAIRAALTGHLVFSTLHTNDAASAISRLTDMGVEPFLLTAALRLIMAQRLVRRICTHCKHETAISPHHAHDLEVSVHTTVYEGTGCTFCNDTGYKGRVALFELLPINEAIHNDILSHASAKTLREKASQTHAQTLRDYGVQLIRKGITTPQEVIRETIL